MIHLNGGKFLSVIFFPFQKFNGYCFEKAERLRDTVRNIPFNAVPFTQREKEKDHRYMLAIGQRNLFILISVVIS